MSVVCLNLSPAYELVYSVHERGEEVNTADAFGIVPGGKGLNVAAMLADAGVDVDLVIPSLQGSMAAGYLSEISEAFPSMPIHTLNDVTVPLRYSTVIVDQGNPFRTRVYRTTFEPNPHLAEQYVGSLIHTLAGIIDRLEAIVMSGSPGAFGASAYSEVIQLARSYGCQTYLDVGGAALDGVLDGEWPSVIKINRAEADQHPLLRSRRGGGEHASLVVVTNGPSDIEVINLETGKLGCLSPPQSVVPVSPTGAGDAFMAGMVWAREISMPDASLESQILEACTWGGRALGSLNSGIGVGR